MVPVLFTTLATLLGAAPGGDADRAAEPNIPSPLTLEAAETLLRQHGLDLLIAEAQVRGAEGDLRAAGVVQNPTVGADFLYGFAITAGGQQIPSVPGYNVQLSDNAAIEDILAGKRGLRQDVARRALDAARQSRADAERNLLAQLRTAFSQAVLAEDNLGFAKEVQEAYQRTRSLNEMRLSKGDINEADLARVVTAQLEAAQQVTAAEQQLAQAKAALVFLLGVRSHALDFSIDGDLTFRTVTAIDDSSADRLAQLAFAHRPDLLAAAATREQKAYAVAQAKRLVFPDISLNVGFGSQYLPDNANSVIQSPTLSVGLSAPIPVFYQQQGEIQRAEADFLTAEHQEQKAKAQIVSDVVQAFAAYKSAREMVQRMEGELLGSAKKARDIEELLYRKGAASLLEFLDAERTYIATNLEYRGDLEAYWGSVYQLEQATGAGLR